MFGAYVQELLREAITRQDGADNLYLVADEATAIRPSNGDFLLETANGRSHRVDAAVLALGNVVEAKDELPGYVANPWSAAATAPLEPGRPVVVLGTGLTMVDVCLGLVEGGFAGPIHAISRRGLLPLGSCAVDALGRSSAARAGTGARCWPCSAPCGARCAAPAARRSAGVR